MIQSRISPSTNEKEVEMTCHINAMTGVEGDVVVKCSR